MKRLREEILQTDIFFIEAFLLVSYLESGQFQHWEKVADALACHIYFSVYIWFGVGVSFYPDVRESRPSDMVKQNNSRAFLVYKYVFSLCDGKVSQEVFFDKNKSVFLYSGKLLQHFHPLVLHTLCCF